MMRLIFPVTPGYLYRTGEIKIEGSKALNLKAIRTLVKLEPGEIYSTKDREKSVEDISEVFRDGGFVYCQVIPVENLDPKSKIVNVTFNINEGEIAFLNRLEFRGNTYTKDKVIRREMIIREGDRFGMNMFKNSILRIKQLGLVDLEKDPDIKPDPDDPTKMNVTVNVKELQRNNIQFTAGYSGYEGTFVAFSYSTVNFLGAGRDAGARRPAGEAHQELLLRLLRAVPLRQAHHGRASTSTTAGPTTPTTPGYWQKGAGHRPDDRDAALRDVAGQPDLHLPEGRDDYLRRILTTRSRRPTTSSTATRSTT